MRLTTRSGFLPGETAVPPVARASTSRGATCRSTPPASRLAGIVKTCIAVRAATAAAATSVICAGEGATNPAENSATTLRPGTVRRASSRPASPLSVPPASTGWDSRISGIGAATGTGSAVTSRLGSVTAASLKAGSAGTFGDARMDGAIRPAVRASASLATGCSVARDNIWSLGNGSSTTASRSATPRRSSRARPAVTAARSSPRTRPAWSTTRMTFRIGSAAKAVNSAARAWRAAASEEAPGPRLTRRRASTRLGLPSTETVMSAGLRLSGVRPSRSTTTRSKEIPGGAAGS